MVALSNASRRYASLFAYDSLIKTEKFIKQVCLTMLFVIVFKLLTSRNAIY